MDCTEYHNTFRTIACKQGIQSICIDKPETLYYDESGNCKWLKVTEKGKLNSEELFFVLGGVQSESPISMSELKAAMKKEEGKELKAKDDLKGSFVDLLRKEHMRNILTLIDTHDWHIHFQAVAILYFGFVDIVDSIEGLSINPIEFKALLYEVLKKDINRTVVHFRKHKYPDVPTAKMNSFIDGIIEMIDARIKELVSQLLMNPMLLYMKTAFEKAKSQKVFPFIQDETSDKWVHEFVQFFRDEIIRFPSKTLIFDEEKQVQAIVVKEEYVINGQKLTNYTFRNSNSDAMIQVSDYVVGILRKYFIFLDRTESEISKDIKVFTTEQMSSFKLLNKVLANSINYNPIFVNITSNNHTRLKYLKCLHEYGELEK